MPDHRPVRLGLQIFCLITSTTRNKLCVVGMSLIKTLSTQNVGEVSVYLSHASNF